MSSSYERAHDPTPIPRRIPTAPNDVTTNEAEDKTTRDDAGEMRKTKSHEGEPVTRSPSWELAFRGGAS